jgi:CubicO group peptidase (beta-lactamase class C family)
VRILETATVKRMTEITDPELRGLGWDLLSPYASAPRGEVFEKGTSYGHTGYTGTTIWIDPKTKSFYVFLSNRVYLGEDNTAKPFTALRRELSTEIGRFIYSTSSTPETLQ